jgi:hypothetical protein
MSGIIPLIGDGEKFSWRYTLEKGDRSQFNRDVRVCFTM